MNIAILDGYALNPGDLSWLPLKKLGAVNIYDRTAPDEVAMRAKDADIVVTNKVVFGRQEIINLPCLKCIVVTATGYNIIDLDAAKEHGITVCNAPAYSTYSVAQSVIALLLHICNRVAQYSDDVRDGRWAQSKDFSNLNHPTTELAGKTIGIIGYGNIGSAVGNVAHALGMHVAALSSKPSALLPHFVEKMELNTLLESADVVSLHCPLTPQTHHLINTDTLARIKSGAILLNTARGPLVDESALVAALQSGRLSAYGADVLEHEPPTLDCALINAPNTFFTPHIAWATKESRQRLMDITVSNVRAFIHGNPINIIN